MLGFIKETFIVLVFIDLNPGKLHYYPFMVNLNSCNTVGDPYGRDCVSNNMEGEDWKVFNMIK